MDQAAILKAFTDLPDSRRRAGKRHSLCLCLALFTLAVAAGNRGVMAVGDWIDAYRAELIELLEVDKERLPSYSTIRRVLMGLDVKTYSQCLAKFFRSTIPEEITEEIVANDGQLKTHQAAMLVKAYLCRRGFPLEIDKDNPKPHEFRKLPKFIRTMAVQGVVFALDALDNHQG